MAPSPRYNPALAPDVPKTPRWAEQLVRLLDDGLTLPGTRIGNRLGRHLGLPVPDPG